MDHRAGFALPLALADREVPAEQRVAAFAVGLRSVSTPSSVLAAGHWFEVLRLDTSALAAEMVEREPLRNGADPCLVRDAVSLPILPLVL